MNKLNGNQSFSYLKLKVLFLFIFISFLAIRCEGQNKYWKFSVTSDTQVKSYCKNTCRTSCCEQKGTINKTIRRLDKLFYFESCRPDYFVDVERFIHESKDASYCTKISPKLWEEKVIRYRWYMILETMYLNYFGDDEDEVDDYAMTFNYERHFDRAQLGSRGVVSLSLASKIGVTRKSELLIAAEVAGNYIITNMNTAITLGYGYDFLRQLRCESRSDYVKMGIKLFIF